MATAVLSAGGNLEINTVTTFFKFGIRDYAYLEILIFHTSRARFVRIFCLSSIESEVHCLNGFKFLTARSIWLFFPTCIGSTIDFFRYNFDCL